jgi:hypothetical protein
MIVITLTNHATGAQLPRQPPLSVLHMMNDTLLFDGT